MCLLHLLQGNRKGGAPLEYHVLIFLGLLLGGANMGKRGDDQERTFFLANTVQVHFV